MNAQRVIIAASAHLTLLGVLAADWLLDSHLPSLTVLILVGALALAELYPLFRRMGLQSSPEYGIACLCVLFLLRGLLGYLGFTPEESRLVTLVAFGGFAFGPLVVLVFLRAPSAEEVRYPFERLAVTFLGLLIVWYTLSFLLELRLLVSVEDGLTAGLKLALILLVGVKVGDSCAYVVGKSIGVRPLTRISPRKTWEGAIGSLAGTVAVAAVLGVLFGFNLFEMIGFGVVISIAGQMGDLVESLLKRRAGVKDSGRFFRASGGFLDLLDSLLLAGPAGYLFVRLVVLG